MCVTFTGCALLCGETVSRQQSSHATLKPKLQVQIKMMVMKDQNAKACCDFVWIKPMGDWDGVRDYLVFPVGVRKATDHLCRGSWRGDPGLVISLGLTSRKNPPQAQEPRPLTLPGLGGEELGGGVSGKWFSKLESPREARWGRAIAKRVSPPGKAKGGSHVLHWA